MLRSIKIFPLLLAAACAPPPVTTKPAGPSPATQPEKTTVAAVSGKCLQALQRQEHRAGFALVLLADDVLAPEQIERLDVLTRKIHGTPGVESVHSITDETVIKASELGVSVEPFVSEADLETPDQRQQRSLQFHDLIDPVLLSKDRKAAMLKIKLQRTAKKQARTDIRKRILDLVFTAPESIKLYLVEYPLAAVESMGWQTDNALAGLHELNKNLAGGGVLEVTVRCKEDDCLLEPLHLTTIARFQYILESMPKVKATRSLVNVLLAANRAVGGQNRIPTTKDESLQLTAMMSMGGGFRLLAEEGMRQGVVRVYFTTTSAAEYCELGRVLKRAAKESSIETLRFSVRRPGREGF
jgi:predicted RND superfamily exporter protein